MIKTKKRIYLIAIIFIILIIITTIFISNKVNGKNESKEGTINGNTALLDNEKALNEIENALKDKSDKTILIVGKNKISEKEIALIDLQINNQYINSNGETKNAIDEAIRQYTILQNAEQINIFLTDEEVKEIETNVNEYTNANEKEMQNILETFNMTYDQFINFYIDRTKKLEIISKWEANIIDKINNGEIQIESEDFTNKYTEYKACEDISRKTSLLLELLKIYEEYLTNQSSIEYLN